MTFLLRLLAIMLAAGTFGLAIAILVVSRQVLAAPSLVSRKLSGSGGGFLFLHIVAVTVAVQGFVAWGLVEVFVRIGDSITWRAPLLVVLSAVLNVAYAIIYRIELARLRLQELGATQ